MTLTYGGRLGIGITQQIIKLHVIGDSRVTGIATFESSVFIDGSLSINSLSVDNLSSNTFTGNLEGNVNGTGISTVGRLSVGSTVVYQNNLSLILEQVYIQKLQMFIFSAGGAADGFIIELGGAVGIGTTVDDEDSHITVGGNITVHNSIGVGTIAPRGLLDLSAPYGQRSYGGMSGITTNNFMLPPMVTNAIQTALVTYTGAIVYNTDLINLECTQETLGRISTDDIT